MHAFIFETLEWVSANYHPEGSALIIAPTLERAREIYATYLNEQGEDSYCGPRATDHKAAKTITPDHTYPLAGNPEENLIIFQDSGCC